MVRWSEESKARRGDGDVGGAAEVGYGHWRWGLGIENRECSEKF